MKTFFKSLFAVLFLVTTNTQLFAGYNQVSKAEQIILIKENCTHHTSEQQKTQKGSQLVQEWIWSKPGKKWLGISWTNIIRKYKELRTMDNYKFLNNDIIHQTDYNPISTTKLSENAKGLMLVISGWVVFGLDYYFNIFNRKK